MKITLLKAWVFWPLAFLSVLSTQGLSQRLYSSPPNCSAEYLNALRERPDTALGLSAVQRCGEKGGKFLSEIILKHRSEKDSAILAQLYRRGVGLQATDANILSSGISVASDNSASIRARLGATLTLLRQYSHRPFWTKMYSQ